MPEVFISYRRDKGSSLASFFESYLKSKGFDCNIDVSSKYTGDFTTFILNEVSNSNLFILLLTEGSIARMVDRKDNSYLELKHAFLMDIPVLPIITEGVDMFKDIAEHKGSLPEEVLKLESINCRFYKHELRDDTLNYLESYLRELRKTTTSMGNEFVVRDVITDNAKELDPYIKAHKRHPIKVNGATYLFTGRMLFTDKPNGYCEFVGEGGLLISGDFEPSNSYAGEVRITKNSELLYEGEVVNLLYEGKGTLYFDDYEHQGIFNRGKTIGYGKRKYRDGRTMEGTWVNEVLSNDGITRFPDGRMFKGKVTNERPDGYGTMYYRGTTYTGFFRNGTMSNKFIQEDKQWIKVSELTDDLEMKGEGHILTKSGDLFFKGKFTDGKSEGTGKYYASKHTLSPLQIAIPSIPEDIIKHLSEEHGEVIIEVTIEDDVVLDEKGYRITTGNGVLLLKVSEVGDKGLQKYEFYNDSFEVINTLNI